MHKTTAILGRQAKSIGTSNSSVSCATLSSKLMDSFPLSGSHNAIDFIKLGQECRVFFPALPAWDGMVGGVCCFYVF
jgi:hypothetical protein